MAATLTLRLTRTQAKMLQLMLMGFNEIAKDSDNYTHHAILGYREMQEIVDDLVDKFDRREAAAKALYEAFQKWGRHARGAENDRTEED